MPVSQRSAPASQERPGAWNQPDRRLNRGLSYRLELVVRHMSVRALAWAWTVTTTTPSERLVLLALADHAGEDGECWPGGARLAVKTGLSEQSVRRYLTLLDERGLIVKVERRRRKDGTLGTWLYRLQLGETGTASGQVVTSANGRPVVTDERTSDHPLAVVQCSPISTHESSVIEPSEEPSASYSSALVLLTPEAVATRATAKGDPDGFADWWTLYPRKVSRKTAAAAWQKMTPADRAAASSALPVHLAHWSRAGTAQGFLPHPSTWLNQRRWEDDLSAHWTPATVGKPDPLIAKLRADYAADHGREQARPLPELQYDHDHDDHGAEW